MRPLSLQTILITCFLLSQTLSAQLSEKDSLEKRLPNLKGIEKIDALLELADLYIASDLDRSFLYSREALDLSYQQNDPLYQGRSNRMLGICYSENEDHDSSKYFLERSLEYIPDDALTYFFLGQNEWFNGNDMISNLFYQKAEKYSIRNKDYKTLAITYTAFAEYYRYIQEDSLSQHYIGLSIKLLERSSFPGDLAMAYNVQAELLRKKGDYTSALEMYRKTAQIAYQMLDSNRIGYCFSRMGYVYYMQGQFNQAESYLLRALTISEQTGSRHLKSFILGALADLYSNIGDVERCRYYVQKSIAHATEIKDFEKISLAYSSLSTLYFRVGSLDSSMVYASLSYNLAKENGDILNMLNAILNKTEIEFKRNRFLQVISLTDEGISLANITGTMEHLKDLYMYRYRAYEKTGNKVEAFDAYENYKMFEDSLQNDNVELSIKESQLEISYQDKHLADTLAFIRQTQKTEQEILLQKQRSVYFIVIGIIITVLLSIIIIVIWITSRNRKKLNLSLAESNRDKELLLKEIHHRVKNSLQVVSSLLNLQKGGSSQRNFNELIDESQVKISNIAIVHELLYQSSNFKSIQLQHYIDKLCDHILRTFNSSSGNIEIIRDVEDIEVSLDKSVPLALIVNEIITNSVKYAFNDGRKGIITIVAKKVNNRVTVQIQDNGPGFPENNPGLSKGIGMALIQGFIKQLKGELKYGNNNGCFFVFSFPD